MDTDDLSTPTYQGIIIEAERLNHDLTLQFGILASGCKNDDDYLNKSETIIREWLSEDNLGVVSDYIFYGEEIDPEAFRTTLKKLLSNIAEIRKSRWTGEHTKTNKNG